MNQFSTPDLVAIATVLVAAIALVWWLLLPSPFKESAAPTIVPPAKQASVANNPFVRQAIIGQSVEGRMIEVYQIGTGPIDLLLVGGIHGGYEWNSSLLAWEMIDHFATASTSLPEHITLHIIPTLNPDGLNLVVGTSSRFTLSDVPAPNIRIAEGRFNANGVDLNRNFDCNWQPESTWRGNVVSAGTTPFSEPEAAALREYVMQTQPEAAVFWHSQANNVYGSACGNGVLPTTNALGSLYATAAQYGYIDFFDAYPVTGDVEGWLATLGIPAVTVELENYNDSEFERNLSGVQTWLVDTTYLRPPEE